MDIQTACKMTGFSRCHFGPDSDPCEVCDKAGQQLYFRPTDPFSSDGQYYCYTCVTKEAAENARYIA